MSWPAVPLRSTLGDWTGRTIAVGGKGDLNLPTTALLHIGRIRRDGQVRVIYIDMAHQKLEPADEVLLPADLTISEAVLGLAHVRPDRAALPPKVRGLAQQSKRRGMQTLAVSTGLAVVLALILQQPGLSLGASIMVVATIVSFLWPRA